MAVDNFASVVERTWSGATLELRAGHSTGEPRDISAGATRLLVMLDNSGSVEARTRPHLRDGSAYRGPQHLSIVPKGVSVWGWGEENARYRCAFITFSDELIEAALEGAPRPLEPRMMIHDPILWQSAARLAAEAANPAPGSRLLGDGLVATLAVDLVRATGREEPRRGGLAPWQLRRVTDHMRAHLGEDLTIAALAGLVGLSPFHFARSFKVSTGVSPGRYQAMLRLERAKEAMAASDGSLEEIAREVGFETGQGLTRLFRRELGVSPRTWRREARG
jgi:AraC-like DNA-binding protein